MTDELRKKAEAQLRLSENANANECSTEETQNLIHELRVHQIELEMQNEELRKTQSQLEAAALRYSNLYNFAPIGYITIDKDAVVLEANATAGRILNTDIKSIVGAPFTKFITPDDQDIFYYARQTLQHITDNPLTWELRLKRSGDAFIWSHFEAVVSSDSAATSTALLAFSDITKIKKEDDIRHKLEKQLQIQDRLQSIGALAGGIAHDFNNMLACIYNNIFLAHTALSHAEPQTDDIRCAIEFINKSAHTIDRTRALTQQLLTFSSGGAPTQKVGDLASCVRDSVQFALSGSSVNSNINIAKDLWACNFDCNQISQVIHNLVLNALQAMPDGGNLSISIKNTYSQNLPFIQVSICDTGVGIAQDVLPQIFDPFFTTKPHGTGLGLSTCFSIIKRHGGAIDVESKPQQGSNFVFTLPAAPGESVTSNGDQRVAASQALTKGTILIMDDEEDIRESMKALLDGEGYKVITARNGQEAIDTVKNEVEAKHEIQAIILDLTVPGAMGGREAVQHIRKLSSSVSVFVSSGYSDDPIISNPRAHGFTDALIKPHTLDQVIQMLQKHQK